VYNRSASFKRATKWTRYRPGWKAAAIGFLPLVALCLAASGASSRARSSRTVPRTNLQISTAVLASAALETRMSWSMAYEVGDSKYQPIPSEEMMGVVDRWVWAHRPPFGWTRLGLAEYRMVKSHRSDLARIFSKLTLIGGHSGKFLAGDPYFPVRFASLKNAPVLVISGVSWDTVYNTERTTARSRAATVLQSAILPAFLRIGELPPPRDVKHLAMVVAYSSKDFSDESTFHDPKPEVVVLVAPIDMIAKYARSEVTEEQLVNSGDTYDADRDTVAGLRKVKLSLQ
jgi:hypothetical protein